MGRKKADAGTTPMTRAEIRKAGKAALKRINDRAARYVAESDLRGESIKRDLAHEAACLFETLHTLTLEKQQGTGRPEETRTITSIAGAYRRTVLDLGLTSNRVDPELEDDDL